MGESVCHKDTTIDFRCFCCLPFMVVIALCFGKHSHTHTHKQNETHSNRLKWNRAMSVSLLDQGRCNGTNVIATKTIDAFAVRTHEQRELEWEWETESITRQRRHDDDVERVQSWMNVWNLSLLAILDYGAFVSARGYQKKSIAAHRRHDRRATVQILSTACDLSCQLELIDMWYRNQRPRLSFQVSSTFGSNVPDSKMAHYNLSQDITGFLRFVVYEKWAMGIVCNTAQCASRGTF